MKELSWISAVYLVLAPILAIGGTFTYGLHNGIHWLEVVLFVVMYILTGISITAGYHRYYAHKTYDCHPLIQFFYLCFGAGAIQNSALHWARNHRVHHQKVDQPEDPHNIKKGFFWAHIGWIFFKSPLDNDFSLVPDLKKNQLVMWQHRYYFLLLTVFCFGVPTLIGWTIGRPLGGFLWGGLLRVVIVQHMTSCINSVAHTFGSRPYSLDNTARDSWWLALISNGEGYHNFHHRFASDYRNGHRWFHFDPTKWWIKFLSYFKIVTRMKTAKDESILQARIETDLKNAQIKMQSAPKDLVEGFQKKIQVAYEQLLHAYSQLKSTKTKYHELKKSVLAKSKQSKKEWKLQLRDCHFQFQLAQARWALLIAAVSRLQVGSVPDFPMF